jgi:hypothetical protein
MWIKYDKDINMYHLFSKGETKILSKKEIDKLNTQYSKMKVFV